MELFDEDRDVWLDMASRVSRPLRLRDHVSTSNELTEDEMDEVLEAVSLLLRDGNIPSSNTGDQRVPEDEQGPGEELQVHTASHEHLTLETIPNEILSSIAGMLAVGIDLPYEVIRPDLTTSESRKQEDADARRDLTSLCMVSKRMAPNAQKALYRNVLITNANTLILLYRAFLENPKLGIYVRRMSLNIDHGRPNDKFMIRPWDEHWRVFNGTPIDLNPLLSCAQHSLGEHFPEAVRDSRRAPRKIPVDICFTLQFRVLGHTSNLQALDINVHPFLPLIRTYTKQKMKKRHWKEVGAALSSLWEEVLPCLSTVQKLKMIGNHVPLANLEGVSRARELFSAHICRCFLKLPNLEQLVWVNFSKEWFQTLPFLLVSGINTKSRFKSIRVLELQESPCLPQGLDTICSAFPNLESLVVDNGALHDCFEPEIPYNLRADQDLDQARSEKYLSDSLETLKNLKSLSLGLHYYHELSGTFGPFGTLNLAGLPNLETLELPFHFFARSVLPEGYHQAVVSKATLPRTLKALKITACFDCDDAFEPIGINPTDAAHSYWPPPQRHRDAVVKFLEMLASFHHEYFPSLEYVCYEESELEEDAHEQCPSGNHTIHLTSTSYGTEHLGMAEWALQQKGVMFENRSESFHCLAP